MIPAKLVLEDGRAFLGRRCGYAERRAVGEVVFNTAMSGYQEVLTDPSYARQMVVMTAPMIGNVGMAADDDESLRGGQVAALVVKELSRIASNWRSLIPLPEYLQQHRIVGLCEVDTRSLVQHLRQRGALRGAIVDAAESTQSAQRLAQGVELKDDLVAQVSSPRAYRWERGSPAWQLGGGPAAPADSEDVLQVVVVDFGVKHNILRCLKDAGCAVQVVPAATAAADILARRPAGVLLSNGPGDPSAQVDGIATARALLGKVPLLGICLGHQLLALALGGRCFKLKFGHHGSNHPVLDLRSGKVAITAQNHGYSVEAASLPAPQVVATHRNLNDETLAGFVVPQQAAMAVQFHPEGGPGPHDARPVFAQFVALMRQGKAEHA